MWGGFPKVIEKVFPNAILVYDRFHVMQMVNKALNKFRKHRGITTKGSRTLLLTNAEDLLEKDQLQLQSILSQSPCLQIVYEMKEDFRQIYETSSTPQVARQKFQNWLKSAKLFYWDVCQTIKRHIDGICNYFISRTTSGTMEGINNKCRVVMRRAYGFRNFENLRSRLLAAFSDQHNLSP